jgi:hypothetical protein
MRRLGKRPAGAISTVRGAGCLALLGILCVVFNAYVIPGADTTYGEDPVPDARRLPGRMSLGYGVDPIPLESPLARFQKWRYRFSGRSQGVPASSQPLCQPMAEDKTAPRAGGVYDRVSGAAGSFAARALKGRPALLGCGSFLGLGRLAID